VASGSLEEQYSTQFTCFTSTKVQIEAARSAELARGQALGSLAAGTQFAFFTSTKVQILTQKALQAIYLPY
jgi:hypothetical protein